MPFHYLNELRSSEASLAALLLMALLRLALVLTRSDHLSGRFFLLLGVTCGVALLVMPSLLFVVVAIVGFGWGRQRSLRYVRLALLASAVAAAVLTPWMLRNYQVFGEAMWSRSNFGMELRLSYNDLAWADYERNYFGGAFDFYHPLRTLDAAERVRAEGELPYNRRLFAEAVAWMTQHPGRAADLLAHRIFYFWFPATSRTGQRLFLWFLTLSAFTGIIMLLRSEAGSGARLLLLLWATFPLVYYVIYSTVRYRLPITWSLLLAAAVFWGACWKALRAAAG